MKAAIVIGALVMLAGCARYVGDSEYYWQDGVLWSCRENVEPPLCRPDADWPDHGISAP